MTTHDDALADRLGDGAPGASDADSIAGLLGDGVGTKGVEAEVAFARLRSRMFAAGDDEVHMGRYRVLEPIGRGGMGVVYRAHDPALDRDVALKVLRGDTADQERRLRREARAMARLSHPNVVAVLEVGRHAGEVFVVMELVAGRDAAAWLAARERSWREVLETFMAAGRGLAAAHTVGLVHRDFKPSNVLVGDDGRVRVTDFGLAASGPQASESAGRDASEPVPGPASGPASGESTTATGARVGTPRYMAPEQRLGGRVDPRADQWSFAVSLWEALYGEHPFADPVTGAIDLVRPLPARARAQRGVPAAIGRELARALSSAPERRHASMEALLAGLSAAADRGRNAALGAAAVGGLGLAAIVGLASPPQAVRQCDPEAVLASVWSPARRTALADAFATTGLPAAAWAWAGVETHVDEWSQRWGQAYRSACEAAAEDPDAPAAAAVVSCLRGDLAEVGALLELLELPDDELVARADRATTDLPVPDRCAKTWSRLAGIDPMTLATHEQRMAEVRALGRAGRYADARQRVAEVLAVTPEIPLLQADVQLSLGLNDARLGDLAAGIESVRAAYYAAATAENADLTARAGLSLVMLESRRADLDRAEEWIRHVTPWIERVSEPERRDELQVQVLILTGEIRYDQGRFDEALTALERAHGIIDEETFLEAPRLLNQKGLVQLELSNYERAAALFERAVELQRSQLGPLHPNVALGIANLGNAHWYRGDYDAAERAYREALAIQRAIYGPEHPVIATAMLNLGLVADARSDRQGAISMLEQAVAIRTAALGPEHPETAYAMTTLGSVLARAGEPERGIELHRTAITVFEAALGREHTYAIEARHFLAVALAAIGRHADALALHDEVLALTSTAQGRAQELRAASMREQAVVLRQQGDCEGAERLDQQALALQERILGPEHPSLAHVLIGLADDALCFERFEEAVAFAERALAVERTKASVRGEASWRLARALWGAGRRERVAALLDEAERSLTLEGPGARGSLQSLQRWRAEVLTAAAATP